MATHTVKMGDTLASISQKHYGNPHQGDKIFNANRTHMGHPDNLMPGDTINIPK